MKYSGQEFEEFFEAYVVAALWSSVTGEEDGGITDEHRLEDIDPETIEYMKETCRRFLSGEAYDLIEDEPNPHVAQDAKTRFSQAGHDFWLTQAGHGSGFWDGDWEKNGERLTEISKEFTMNDLYLGDDGVVYGMNPDFDPKPTRRRSPR